MLNNLPQRLFGLTIDDLGDGKKIYNRLKLFKDHVPNAPPPVVRFVFDIDGTTPEDYRDVIQEIKKQKLGFVMGEIMDSQYFRSCRGNKPSTDCYLNRTRSYFETLGDLVDIWEIGNELNGEWVGWFNEREWTNTNVSAQEMGEMRDWVAAQVSAAYNFLKTEQGKPVALTFYFNEDGEGKHSWTDAKKKISDSDDEEVSFGQHYGLFEWAKKYRYLFPQPDYVFVSYYQDNEWIGNKTDRKQFIPSTEQWARIFAKLHDLYQNAKLGFGEVGPECKYLGNDCTPREDSGNCGEARKCKCCRDAQPVYLERYYLSWDANIRSQLSGFGLADKYVGGYFYWHFSPDVVKNRNSKTIEMLKKIYAEWYD